MSRHDSRVNRSRDYLRALENDEIIPDLAGIVGDYTGGYCDSETLGGERCWSSHEGCDNYCLNNLSGWLKPFFVDFVGKPLQSFEDGLVLLRFEKPQEEDDSKFENDSEEENNSIPTELTFPPLPLYITYTNEYVDYNNSFYIILTLTIDHPTYGNDLNFLFNMDTVKAESKYRKSLILQEVPRAFLDLFSGVERFDRTFKYGEKFSDYSDIVINVFSKLEEFLYVNGTSPTKVSASYQVIFYRPGTLDEVMNRKMIKSYGKYYLDSKNDLLQFPDLEESFRQQSDRFFFVFPNLDANFACEIDSIDDYCKIEFNTELQLVFQKPESHKPTKKATDIIKQEPISSRTRSKRTIYGK